MAAAAGNASASLSGGGIAGVVIACIVVVLLLSAGVYWKFMAKQSTPGSGPNLAAEDAAEMGRQSLEFKAMGRDRAFEAWASLTGARSSFVDNMGQRYGGRPSVTEERSGSVSSAFGDDNPIALSRRGAPSPSVVSKKSLSDFSSVVGPENPSGGGKGSRADAFNL